MKLKTKNRNLLNIAGSYKKNNKIDILVARPTKKGEGTNYHQE